MLDEVLYRIEMKGWNLLLNITWMLAELQLDKTGIDYWAERGQDRPPRGGSDVDDPWRIGGGAEIEAAALRGRGEEGTWWANEPNPLDGARRRKRGRGNEEEEEEENKMEEEEKRGEKDDQPQ